MKEVAAMRHERAPRGVSITDPISRPARGAPSKRPWLNQWMALLRTIGNIQAWILLTLFYVVIISPIGLVFRLVADPLRLRRRGSTWQPFARHYDRLDHAAEQS